MDKESIIYDTATISDIPELVRLRILYMIDDFGSLTDEEREGMEKQLPGYFERELGKKLIAFVARAEGRLVAAAYLLIIEKPANPFFLNGLDSEVYRYAIKTLESTHCDNWRYVIYYYYKHAMRGDDMDIAKSIRDLRESTGMSRKEFSEHTGIPVRTLEDWEAGRRTPPEYIPRLIAYQLKYEELMKVKGEKLL